MGYHIGQIHTGGNFYDLEKVIVDDVSGGLSSARFIELWD